MKRTVAAAGILFGALLMGVLILALLGPAVGGSFDSVVNSLAIDGRSRADGAASDRLIIRRAELNLLVAEPAAAGDEIDGWLEEMGGYVVSLTTNRQSEGERLTLVARVPAESLDAFLARVREMALEVRREHITGEDVTESYTDLGARRRHLEAVEARLLELMEGAEDTEATLAVYTELQAIQGELEQVMGRMGYLEESAAMSQVEIVLARGAVDVWQPAGTLEQAVQALGDALRFGVDAGIWLAVFGVPMVVIAVPVVWLVRRFRQRS